MLRHRLQRLPTDSHRPSARLTVRYFRPRALALVLALGVCVTSRGADAFRACRFVKPLDAAQVTRDEIAAVPLDREVYAHTRADFADVRLRQGDGPEVPFVLEKRRYPRTRFVDEQVPTQVEGLRELAGNRIEITVRVTRQTLPVAFIQVETPLRDYEKQVSVCGSQDAVQWTSVVSGQPIFDYSRYMDVRGNRIEMPNTAFAVYRVAIENVTDMQSSVFLELTRQVRGVEPISEQGRTVLERRDFRIDRLTLWGRRAVEGEAADVEVEYPIAGFEARVDATRKWTELRIQTSREPLCALELVTSSRNFSRRVRVQVRRQGPGTTEPWIDIGDGHIQALAFRGAAKSQLTLRFPESRAAEYRLLVLDGDSPPLDFTGATGMGKAYRAVFLAAPGHRYRLYFGNERAQLPAYDAAAVLGALTPQRAPGPVELSPGALEPNPAYGRRDGLSGLLENRMLFGAAIALVLAGLGWGLARALRRIDQIAPPGSEPDA
jgi:hypothetical protein